MRQTTLRKIAAVVSAVFQPVFVPLYVLMLWWMVVPVAFLSEYTIFCSICMATFTFLLPGVVHLILYFTHQISDFFISNPKERNLIYMVSIVCTLLGFLMLNYMECWPLTSFLLASLLALFVVWIINHFWKISAHMAAWSCMVGCVYLFELETHRLDVECIILLVLIGGLLGWSRVEQRAHTLAQVLCGELLGVAASLVMLI